MGKEIKKDSQETRVAQKANEGLETLTNGTAPKDRFQTSQQVNKAENATETNAGSNSFTQKKVAAKGGTLKQDVAAAVLLDEKGVGGNPLSGVASVQRAGLKSMSYSGDSGTILGTAASTPQMGAPFRAGDRYGKRMDETNKKINFLASEQILVEYDAPKPLAENDSTQGYNGTPKNSAARSQKNNGFSNAELLYDRSLDEIRRDIGVFTAGQVVKQVGVKYDDAPTETQILDYTTGEVSKEPFAITRGNYMPREIQVEFTKDANGVFVSKFTPVVDDISCNAEDQAVVNASSSNEIIDMNVAEIDRQNIDSKAGRETQADWNPLGRAVNQPTQTVGYLRDLELMLGSEYFACYKFANKSMAYQLNKAGKDGQRITAPLREMFYGLMAKTHSSEDFEDEGAYGTLFNKDFMKNGSADILLALFDSKSKYRNKADALTQPRSLKMHLQTADNNMNVYRIKPEFVAALNTQDVFATIDRGYDPMSVVCLTDSCKLIHPYDWSKQFSYTQEREGGVIKRTWISKLFAYYYANRSSNYYIKVTNPLLAGIAYFCEQYAEKLYGELATTAGAGKVTWRIPVVHSTTSFSLWDFLVLAATPFVQYERTNAMKDVLDFEVNFGYPFSQLVTIKDANPMNAVNYTITSYADRLQSHEMEASCAITWIMPETFWKAGNQIVHPWYFSEDQFDFTAAGKFVQKDWSGSMSIPVIRSGIRMAYLDDIYGMSERDVRLCLDRMVRSPFDKTGHDTMTGCVYKYSQNSEGIIAVTLDKQEVGDPTFLMSVPRELGWFFVLPGDVATHKFTNTADATVAIGGTYTDTYNYALRTSYKCRFWKQKAKVAITGELNPASVLIDRGQSFSSPWFEFVAGEEVTGDAPIYEGEMVLAVGKYLQRGTKAISGTTNLLFTPFTDGYSSRNGQDGYAAQTHLEGVDYTVGAINKAFWARLQKMPFVVSPFDTERNGNMDVYDVAYLFNMAGFMASDYNEDIYNRLNQRQNQGWLFTEDPFVNDSPVFKDARRYTQV